MSGEMCFWWRRRNAVFHPGTISEREMVIFFNNTERRGGNVLFLSYALARTGRNFQLYRTFTKLICFGGAARPSELYVTRAITIRRLGALSFIKLDDGEKNSRISPS